jgi:hypothetical protein
MERTMKLKLILALASSLLSLQAIADDWSPLATDQGQTAQIDASSIRKDGDEVVVKVMRDYAKSQLNVFDGLWVSYRSKIVVYVVDCADGKLAHLEWTLHASGKGRGRVVKSGEAGAVLQARGPQETGDDVLIDRVCTRIAQMESDKTMLAEAAE